MTEVKQLVQDLADQYGRNQESLLPILQGIVNREQHISEDAMIEVARELNISAAQVYGTATFYSFLNTKPLGKYVIRVCKTITCMMHGKNQIIKELETVLKVNLEKPHTMANLPCSKQTALVNVIKGRQC